DRVKARLLRVYSRLGQRRNWRTRGYPDSDRGLLIRHFSCLPVRGVLCLIHGILRRSCDSALADTYRLVYRTVYRVVQDGVVVSEIVTGVAASHSTLMNTHWEEVHHKDRAEHFLDGLNRARDTIATA